MEHAGARDGALRVANEHGHAAETPLISPAPTAPATDAQSLDAPATDAQSPAPTPAAAAQSPDAPATDAQSPDALFEHLSELVDRLPQMQQLDDQLKRAQAAEKVAEAQRDLATCEAMLSCAQEALGEQKAGLDEALSSGDTAAADKFQHGVLFFAQERGLRVGPVNNARAALDEALRDGGFSDAKEAEAARLPQERRDGIADELAAYRADYDKTFRACQDAEAADGWA